jgi:hypothetical protein
MAALKTILNAVVKDLGSRTLHVAHVLSGPRCEQWLNPEVRAAVNAAVRRTAKRSPAGKPEYVNAEVPYGNQRADFVVLAVSKRNANARRRLHR